MRIEEVISALSLTPLTVSDSQRQTDGAYVGDLLSWVMGNGRPDMVWVTIMTNINVVAVASLIDFSAVVFAEGCVPDQDVVDAAQSKGVNLLVSDKSAYEVCVALGALAV